MKVSCALTRKETGRQLVVSH